MDLSTPKPVAASGNVTTFGVFACFESCKLLPYISETTQFNIIGQNSISMWELITVEWLTKVKGIIDRSVDNPKSQAKFLAVLDLWRRATAGYLFFRTLENSADWCRELPEWMTEADAAEIWRVERQAYASRQNANLDAGRQLWFCDETDSPESDRFTPGRGVAGEDGQEFESEETNLIRRQALIAEEMSKPIPEVGSEILVADPPRVFGGRIQPGSFLVSAAGRDRFGRGVVDLSRDGRLVISGISTSRLV